MSNLENFAEDLFVLESVSEKIDAIAKLMRLPRADVQKDMQTLITRFKATKRGKNPIEMTPQEFKAAAEYLNRENMVLGFKAPKDAPVVAQNDKAIVWAVNSHEFCRTLQKYGVSWCISTANPVYLRNYLDDSNFYVLQNKSNPEEIYSIATNKDGSKFHEDNHRSVDKNNANIDPVATLTKFGISPQVIQNWNYETPEIQGGDLTTQLTGPSAGVYGADGIISALRKGVSLNDSMHEIVDSIPKENEKDGRTSANKLAHFFIKEKKTAYRPLIKRLLFRAPFLLSPENIDKLYNMFIKGEPDDQRYMSFLAMFGAVPPKYRDKNYETEVFREDMQDNFGLLDYYGWETLEANPAPYLDDAHAVDLYNMMVNINRRGLIHPLTRKSKPFKNAVWKAANPAKYNDIREYIRDYVMSFPDGPREGRVSPEVWETMIEPVAAYIKESEKTGLFQDEVIPLLAGMFGRYDLGMVERNHIADRIKRVTTPEQRESLTAAMMEGDKKLLQDILESNPFGLPQYREKLVKQMEALADIPYEKKSWHYEMSLKSLLAHWPVYINYVTPELLYSFLNHEEHGNLLEHNFDQTKLEENCKRIWLYLKRHLPRAVAPANIPYDSVIHQISQIARIPLTTPGEELQ